MNTHDRLLSASVHKKESNRQTFKKKLLNETASMCNLKINQITFISFTSLLALSEVGRSASQNNLNPGYNDSNGPPTPPPTYSYIERQTSYVSDISQRSSQSKCIFCVQCSPYLKTKKKKSTGNMIFRVDSSLEDIRNGKVQPEIAFQYQCHRIMMRRSRCLIHRVKGVGPDAGPASLAPAPAAPVGATGRGFPSSDPSQLRRR